MNTDISETSREDQESEKSEKPKVVEKSYIYSKYREFIKKGVITVKNGELRDGFMHVENG